MTELTPRPTAQAPNVGTHETNPPIPCDDPIPSLPIVILSPHSRCNCRCLMCDIWRDTKKQEISAQDIAAWLSEWCALGTRRVVLTGGEPLMHSSLWEVCALFRGADIGVTIISTGLLLQRHAEQLVEYCDDVVVSLDGPQQVHDRIRNIPRAFEKLAAGVRAVNDASPDVRVSGRCTVQRANFRMLRQTVDAAHEIGLDHISFLAADVSSEAFNRPGGWPVERAHDVALGRDDLPFLHDELAALERDYARDFETGYISESPTKLKHRLEQYFTALLGDGNFWPVDCNAPWVSTVIETDGTVRPCFFQPPLGNLYESGSLDRILNSPDALAWRRRLDTHRNEICRTCVCSLLLRQSSEDLAECRPG